MPTIVSFELLARCFNRAATGRGGLRTDPSPESVMKLEYWISWNIEKKRE